MIRFFLYACLLFVSLLLESTLIQVPLVLAVLLLIAIFQKREWLLIVGMITGFFLDSISFRPIGQSGLFFLCMLFVLYLYGRKFEIQHIGFDAFFCFITSSIYGVLFGFQQPFVGAFIGTILVVCALFSFQFFQRKKQKTVGY